MMLKQGTFYESLSVQERDYIRWLERRAFYAGFLIGAFATALLVSYWSS